MTLLQAPSSEPSTPEPSPERPIVILATCAHPVETDSVALILAWLPGSLKTHEFSPRSQEALEEFSQATYLASFPAEIGLATSEISELADFKRAMLNPGQAWAFSHTQARQADLAQLTPMAQPRQALHPDQLREILETWARRRLESFILVEEHSFWSQMEARPNLIESLVAAPLQAQREALLLQNATPEPAARKPRSL